MLKISCTDEVAYYDQYYAQNYSQNLQQIWYTWY